MTALLLDLGNSRWKMASSDGDGNIGTVAADDYSSSAAMLDAIRQAPADIDRVLLAGVAEPRRSEQIVALLERELGCPLRMVKATDAMPNLVSGYRKPWQLGVDRLLAMVAARARTHDPLCVVDAGTAVTIDFVAPDGQHLGGFILPGARLFRDCLLANTAIPRDAEVETGATIGRDTPTAVALAGRYAVVGIVEHHLQGPAALFPGRPVQLFVGGGDAESLVELLPRPCTKMDELVLRGLAVMAAGEEA